MGERASHFVIIGHVAGVYGVRGWVKVVTDLDPPERLLAYPVWQVGHAAQWRPTRLVTGRLYGKGVLAHLASCDDRDVARALIGAEIAVARHDLPDPGPHQYYWADLEGLRVRTVDGIELGTVDHLLETGANDVLVVRGDRERLIPYVRESVIKAVDPAQGVILVDWDPEYWVRIDVVTLFPELFEIARRNGVTGKAVQRGIVDVGVWNPRDYTCDRHRSVDDRPYGGGPGMVMMVQPLRDAIRAARESAPQSAVIYLSPQGRRLDQAAVVEWANRPGMILVAGRYEGIDQRVIDSDIDEEWSIGDYVLSGGELAALVVIDAVTRLRPGVLGDEQSAAQDSFAAGLLDHPHYTRPEAVDGASVPGVLISGDHAAIARWRVKQAVGRTWLRRPDLLERLNLSAEQQALLNEFKGEQSP